MEVVMIQPLYGGGGGDQSENWPLGAITKERKLLYDYFWMNMD